MNTDVLKDVATTFYDFNLRLTVVSQASLVEVARMKMAQGGIEGTFINYKYDSKLNQTYKQTQDFPINQAYKSIDGISVQVYPEVDINWKRGFSALPSEYISLGDL